MKCLCCGLELSNNATALEIQNQWHNKCVKKFFETTSIPCIDITRETFKLITTKNIEKGLDVLKLTRAMDVKHGPRQLHYKKGFAIQKVCQNQYFQVEKLILIVPWS